MVTAVAEVFIPQDVKFYRNLHRCLSWQGTLVQSTQWNVYKIMPLPPNSIKHFRYFFPLLLEKKRSANQDRPHKNKTEWNKTWWASFLLLLSWLEYQRQLSRQTYLLFQTNTSSGLLHKQTLKHKVLATSSVAAYKWYGKTEVDFWHKQVDRNYQPKPYTHTDTYTDQWSNATKNVPATKLATSTWSNTKSNTN